MTALFLQNVGLWGWFIAGVVLLLLEALLPGVFLFWFGLAAFGVGALAWALDLGWQAQWIIFALLAIVTVAFWVRWSRKRNENGMSSDEPMLNRRAERQIGRVFVLEDPIVQGVGRVRIDDTVWRIEGPDAAVGTAIRISGVRGSALQAELATAEA